MMSVRGQSVWHGQGVSASPLPGIPGSLDARTMQNYDGVRYTADVVKTYGDKWNGVFRAR